MSEDKVPVVIIGAGVLGCAVAAELSRQGIESYVLEKGPRIAEGVTSRNSGVIHAGIYYPPNSLKAESCIRGSALLYEWCEKYGVPYKRTGKWIVAVENEQPELEAIYKNAIDSGARGISLKKITSNDPISEWVNSTHAIFSAETGIVDPYLYSKSFRDYAENNGSQFLVMTDVHGIEKISGGYRIETNRGPINAEKVVNAAGLYCDDIARMVGTDKYKIYPCRGNYYGVRSSIPYNTLIYPVRKKNAPGLGVHVTIGLDGSVRLGPDTEYLTDKADFSTPKNPEEKKKQFFESAKSYLKGITEDQLFYDTCGIRPKLRSPEEKMEKDFIISEDLAGFLNLVGIESPGLTASIDLAQRAAKILNG